MKTIWKKSFCILITIIFFSCGKDALISPESDIQKEHYSLENEHIQISSQSDIQAETYSFDQEEITLILDNAPPIVIDSPTNYIVPVGSRVTSLIIEEEIVVAAPCDIISVRVSFSIFNGWCVSIEMGDANGSVGAGRCSISLTAAAYKAFHAVNASMGCL